MLILRLYLFSMELLGKKLKNWSIVKISSLIKNQLNNKENAFFGVMTEHFRKIVTRNFAEI